VDSTFFCLENIFLDFELIILGVIWATLGTSIFAFVVAFLERHKIRFQYLMVFYLAHLVSVIDDIYWLSDSWEQVPQLTNVYTPFLYLLAPAFYCYLQNLIAPQTHTKFKLWSYHWLGFILALVLCLPYYFLDSTTKLERLMAPSGTLEHIGMITIGAQTALLLYIPFSFIYLVMALRLVAKNLTNIKSFFSNIENKDLSWIRWMVIILMIALAFSVVQLFLPDSYTDTESWELVYAVFGYSWLTLFAALTSRQSAIRIDQAQSPPDSSQPAKAEKYRKSQLGQKEIEHIKKQLIDAMEILKLHRRPGLTLRNLADEISISQNKISQVLNNHLDKGFYDFVNGWRIQDACSIMQKQSKSILEIAYEVGFNSKSTFNTSFKKHTSLTPTQYKKTM